MRPRKGKKTYLIAAMHSGSGKTVFTYGLLKLLTGIGLRVQSFKTGPDYIDPMYHSYITKRPCINLDPFFMEPEEDEEQKKQTHGLKNLFERYANDADVAIIEGAMGYFDGIYGEGRRGSASVVADETDAEVIFLLDAKSSPSVLDVIQYLERYSGAKLYNAAYKNRVKYLVLNRCMAKEHREFSEEFHAKIKAYETLKDIKAIGFIPEWDELKIGSRHLGLRTPDSEAKLDLLADAMQSFIRENVDLGILFPEYGKACFLKKDAEIKKIKKPENENDSMNHKSAKKPEFRIAIAKDQAFCFFYRDNLDALEQAGFSIHFFSPLQDVHLPENIDALWLPGGYPELFAKPLSENKNLREEICLAAKAGLPMIAECGGFMYLHKKMEDMQGNEFAMCGVIDGKVFRTGKLQRFGYIEVEAKKDTILLKQGQKMRGHEFHYFDSTSNGEDALATKANGSKSWECVHAGSGLFAGFPHIYLKSNISMLQNLVHACRNWRGRKMGDLERVIGDIEEIDFEILEEAGKHWNSIAKPLHGLGKLEDMIARIAAIQGRVIPKINEKTIIIMCADNGIVEEGVSQTGKEVTAIVTRNFTIGETSVNKMAKYAGAKILPVDIGVDADFVTENDIDGEMKSDMRSKVRSGEDNGGSCTIFPLRHAKVAKGTKNFLKADAMTKEEALKAIQAGMDLVLECKQGGAKIIGTGEMGIGNTTTSAAIASVLLRLPVSEVTGRGAGLSGEGLIKKIKVISDGISIRKPDAGDPLDVLCKLGGLDIAGLVGVFLGGARYKVPIVLDGLITSVAALVAKRICKKTTQYMLASHLSKEPAGKKIMEELGLSPVIDGNLCLGEGTGCCLLFGMLDTAMCVYENRTTFEDICVEEYREME